MKLVMSDRLVMASIGTAVHLTNMLEIATNPGNSNPKIVTKADLLENLKTDTSNPNMILLVENNEVSIEINDDLLIELMEVHDTLAKAYVSSLVPLMLAIKLAGAQTEAIAKNYGLGNSSVKPTPAPEV